MERKQFIGSYTAKGGLRNEKEIVSKFNNYKSDQDAQLWLEIMGYNHAKVTHLSAIVIPNRLNKKKAIDLGVSEKGFDKIQKFKKADIQLRLEIVVDNTIHIENLSLKKANKDAGFNQVDKRPVDTYKKMWCIPDSITRLLKLYTGELPPYPDANSRDSRRLFLDEIDKEGVAELISFFERNKILVFSDVLRGRGALSAEWLLVTRLDKQTNVVDWILKDMNFACNFFADGCVEVTKRGSLKIGRMTMQRKGGTPDPKSLQFKINPLDLFDVVEND